MRIMNSAMVLASISDAWLFRPDCGFNPAKHENGAMSVRGQTQTNEGTANKVRCAILSCYNFCVYFCTQHVAFHRF